MTATQLLEATQETMIGTSEGIAWSLWMTWRRHSPGVGSWNDACRALLAYIDPYNEGCSNCALYGQVKKFEKLASFHTQMDAIDFAIDYLNRANARADNVIDPRD